MRKLAFFIILPIWLCGQNALAEIPDSKLEWELGAGLSIINFRLYPGAGQSKTYVLPLPYFTLRSKYLEIDRGIRGFLPSHSDWYLDISADFALPVDSDASRLRAGMPDLDAIVQFGPSLQYSLFGARHLQREFRLELPLRAAIVLDAKTPGNEGWLFEPELVYEHRRQGRSGLAVKAGVGLRYATRDYYGYYYDVTPAYASVQRPAFTAEKGYGGFVLELSTSWRQADVIVWSIVRYQNLSGAIYEDSPLVEDKNYYFAMVGISWILSSSP